MSRSHLFKPSLTGGPIRRKYEDKPDGPVYAGAQVLFWPLVFRGHVFYETHPARWTIKYRFLRGGMWRHWMRPGYSGMPLLITVYLAYRAMIWTGILSWAVMQFWLGFGPLGWLAGLTIGTIQAFVLDRITLDW